MPRIEQPKRGGRPRPNHPAVQAFLRSTKTGLHLPDRLAGPHRPSGAEWFSVRAGWRDVYGEDPTWDDVADRLSGFGLGQVLLTLGGVSAVLNSYEPLSGQRRIVSALFDDPEKVGRDFQTCWDRLKREGATGLLRFFSEPQVVAVAKIALLVCPHVTERSSSSLQPIGEALLMAADLIDREEAMGLTPDGRTDVGRDAWLRFVVRNGLFNASDNLAHAFARTYDLYLSEHNDPAVSGDSVDLRRRFEEITGLDPDFAWAMGFALLANWRTVDPKSDRPPGPLSLEAYISAFHLTDAESRGVRELFAVDAGEARNTLRQRGCGPDSLRPYVIQPLDDRPLVSLEGRLYCPSVRLLRWKLTTGLHHVFLKRNDRNDRVKRDVYLTHAGHVFENYVEALFRRVFHVGDERFVDAKTLRRKMPSAGKRCDGIVVDDDTVLLLEYKATLLPRGVRAEGDLDKLRTRVANTLGYASKQFDDTILAVEDGHLGDLVRPARVTRYLPVVITLDTLPVERFFYRTIEEAIAHRSALTHRKARPMQVLAVSELELLEGYMAEGGSLTDLLLDRIRNDTYRDCPLKNHLLAIGAHRVLRPNRWLQGRYKELGKQTMALLRERAGGPL